MTITKPPTNAALYYHPDGYETKRADLMGRHAAGEEFLKAYCRHAGVEELICYAQKQQFFKHFAGKIKTYAEAQRVCKWINWRDWIKLSEVGCLYMPGPVLHELAWQRRHVDNRAFSICGVTHTTATSKVMDSLGELLTSPVQPWDALICTSECVRKTVMTVLSDYAEYLTERLSLEKRVKLPLQLPVIPLGVDCKFYEQDSEKRSEIRKEWRAKLKIQDEEIAVLFFGRLSFHAKAHPMPMYIALEQAAQATGKKFNLVLAGWFASDAIRNQFIESAKLLCPSLRMTIVDGRHPDVRKNVWYACDIFTSLSDNVQETFGLTPVEAMAAGLPVVVSDWNGYKETVTDGVEGYMIPTVMPAPGLGQDLALSYAMGVSSYDEYIGIQSLFTSVDVRACAAAYARLADDEGLRQSMGEAGRRRVATVFDWSVVIGQYQSLWTDLNKIRASAPEDAKRARVANPLRNDPNVIFASYPTNALSPKTLISSLPSASKDRLLLIRAIPIGNYARNFLLDTAEMIKLLETIENRGAMSVADLCLQTAPKKGRALLMTILWFAKMDLIALAEPIESSDEQKSMELISV